MKADPAQLIFFEELTTDRFFEEAEARGVPLEQLQDEDIYDRLFYACLVDIRAKTAREVAEAIGIDVTEEQAESIARNSLVPEVVLDPAPLTPEERKIAAELYYLAVKAAAARHNMPCDDKEARAAAKKMVG